MSRKNKGRSEPPASQPPPGTDAATEDAPKKQKKSAPSVMGFLSRVGGAPTQGSTPARGLLGKISKEDLVRVGRLEGEDGQGDSMDSNPPPPPAPPPADAAPPPAPAPAAAVAPAAVPVATVMVTVPESALVPGAPLAAEPDPTGRNRRTEERYPFRVQVEYTAVGTSATEFAENLSLHGMFILTANPLEVGDAVMVSFAVPQGNLLLTTPARVKWVSAFGTLEMPMPGMGVEFTALDERRKRVLETIIQRLRKPGVE